MPTPQNRVKQSGTNRYVPPTKSRCIVYSFDKEKAPSPSAAPAAESSEEEAFVSKQRLTRHARRQTNPFIKSLAGVDNESSAHKDNIEAYFTMEGFIVGNYKFD